MKQKSTGTGTNRATAGSKTTIKLWKDWTQQEKDDYWQRTDCARAALVKRAQLVDGYQERFAEWRKRAEEAYDFDALRLCCVGEEAALAQFFGCTEYRTEGGRPYWFRDNGASVLAVCHLDSVQDKRVAHTAFVKDYGQVVASPVLDDRLGAYTILCLLPAMGITVDLLLCTDEEGGASTAELFRTEKQYSHIVEFDRTGDDVVCYDYEDDALVELLESYGWRVGMGSYSDISHLQTLGCKAFNVGVSYHDYHSPKAWMEVEPYLDAIARYALLWTDKKDTRLPHVFADRYAYRNSKWYSSGFEYYDYRNSNLVADISEDFDGWSTPLFDDYVIFSRLRHGEAVWGMEEFHNWKADLKARGIETVNDSRLHLRRADAQTWSELTVNPFNDYIQWCTRAGLRHDDPETFMLWPDRIRLAEPKKPAKEEEQEMMDILESLKVEEQNAYLTFCDYNDLDWLEMSSLEKYWDEQDA